MTWTPSISPSAGGDSIGTDLGWSRRFCSMCHSVAHAPTHVRRTRSPTPSAQTSQSRESDNPRHPTLPLEEHARCQLTRRLGLVPPPDDIVVTPTCAAPVGVIEPVRALPAQIWAILPAHTKLVGRLAPLADEGSRVGPSWPLLLPSGAMEQGARTAQVCDATTQDSEGEMIGLETLMGLKFMNSSLSSLSSY